LQGHTDRVDSVAYSPDGRWIVTAGVDGTARVWDAEDGQQKMVVQGHTDWVNSAAYSPDGRWIVTASSDDTARVWWWRGDVQDMLAEARSRVARELTCQERVQYLHEDLDCGLEE
jgi:WD40 repeat protein